MLADDLPQYRDLSTTSFDVLADDRSQYTDLSTTSFNVLADDLPQYTDYQLLLSMYWQMLFHSIHRSIK